MFFERQLGATSGSAMCPNLDDWIFELIEDSNTAVGSGPSHVPDGKIITETAAKLLQECAKAACGRVSSSALRKCSHGDFSQPCEDGKDTIPLRDAPYQMLLEAFRSLDYADAEERQAATGGCTPANRASQHGHLEVEGLPNETGASVAFRQNFDGATFLS